MKILYYALGGEDTASSRLRVHKVSRELISRGHIVRVVTSDMSRKPMDDEIIVVQKRLDLCRVQPRWVAAGHRVVFDIDDPTPKVPDHSVMTVGSKELQAQHEGSIYIPDCLDVDDSTVYKKTHNDEVNSVCWFGLSCNLYHAYPVMMACRELELNFVVVTDVDGRVDVPLWPGVDYRPWSRETIDQEIMSHDLITCPYVEGGRWGTEWTLCKGENRLFKAWALGMPVLGSPIPSYLEHGLQDCAWTPTEWKDLIEKFQDRKLRAANARNGRKIAIKQTTFKITNQWLKVFRNAKS